MVNMIKSLFEGMTSRVIQDMFPHLTEAIVKKLGANSDLISNDALNKKWEMLTLVKIGTKSFFSYFFPRPKYTCYDLKLSDIVDENICLDYNKEILVKDFKNFSLDSVSVEAGGDVVGAQGSVSGNNEESSSPATLMSEGISQRDLAELIMRQQEVKLKAGVEDKFKLMEGEKLAFVKQKVYNTSCVKFKTKTSTSWSFAATFYSFIPGCSEIEKTEVTTFTVPENKVFAFALKEITIDGGYLGPGSAHPFLGPKPCVKEALPCISTVVDELQLAWFYRQAPPLPLLRHDLLLRAAPSHQKHLQLLCCRNILHLTLNLLEEPSHTEVRTADSVWAEDINFRGKVLEPLAGLSESARRELLIKLAELLEDREVLALLGETLDRVGSGEYQRPQCEAVAAFVDLLDVSKVSRDLTEAVQLLVSALEALPDSAAALLAKTGPETLTCISSMIKALKDGQARLPEAPPLPLQEKGELRWVAQFIISANDLEALKKTWAYPHFSPEGLLELLYVSVEGLGRMQSTGKS
ncbi:uncharacterized protein FYW61_015917 [Anableps anableps]